MAKARELVVQEWQRKKRETEEEKAVTKKRQNKARGQTRVNISMAFQQWSELRELKGLTLARFAVDVHYDNDRHFQT